MTSIYLGLDYGAKHIGVAVAATFVAEPVAVIPTAASLDKLKAYIDLYQVTDLVIGLSENQTAQKTQAFARQLEASFHLPVHFQDETLTSQDTRRRLAQQGTKRSVREAKIDHFVAAAILQDFLDSRSAPAAAEV